MLRRLALGLVLVSIGLESTAALAQPDRRGPPYDGRPPMGAMGPGAHRDWRGPPPQGWDRRRWSYRQDYMRRNPTRRDDYSDDIIAGTLGFVLGAAIAGSAEDQRQARDRLNDREWRGWCAQRYRSFDSRSGTYLGMDGMRRYCVRP